MFSDKLRELRIRKKLTQGELGRLVGISASTVGMYEQGRRSPDNKTLARFAEVLDTSADILLGTEDAPRDIEQAISQFRRSLKNSEGLMFKGVPLSEQDIDKLVDAMELSARIVISSDKERYGENQKK